MNEAPLRSPASREAFCTQYFEAVGASLEFTSARYREFKLPLDVDKELTDRPFFWMWAEKTGQPIEPTTLRLAFDEAAEARESDRLRKQALAELEARNPTPVERMFFRPPKVELINLGSFRLERIYRSLERRGRFACVVPSCAAADVKVVPWLMMNAIVSCRCDSVQQEWVSIGVCLANGQSIDQFYQTVSRIPMQPASPSHLLVNAVISMPQAIERAKQRVIAYLQRKPHDWAMEAANRLQAELHQVDTYYNSILPDVSEAEHDIVKADHQRKREELKRKSQPRIEVAINQFALVGLIERQS